MPQNPFLQFNEPERAAFVKFDFRLQKAWNTQQEGMWLQEPGLVWPNTMPYGALETRLTIPTALVSFVKDIGDTVFAELSAKERSYKWVEKWTLGVKENEEKIASDKFTGWPMIPEHAAVKRKDLWLELAAACLDGTETGWDDKTLFATDHKNNLVDGSAGTQSNLSGSMAFSETNFSAGVTLFNKHKNLDGKVAGWEPNVIMFGTDIKESVLDLVLPERASKSGNTLTDKFRGRFKPLWIPQLTTPTDWFLADFSDPLYAPIVRSLGNDGNLELIAHNRQSPMWFKDQSLGLEYKERIHFAVGLFHKIHKFKVAA